MAVYVVSGKPGAGKSINFVEQAERYFKHCRSVRDVKKISPHKASYSASLPIKVVVISGN